MPRIRPARRRRPALRVLAPLRAAARHSMPDTLILSSTVPMGSLGPTFEWEPRTRLVDLLPLVEQCVRYVPCFEDPPLPFPVPGAIAIEGLLYRPSLQDGF
jgi:hypothetical protein